MLSQILSKTTGSSEQSGNGPTHTIIFTPSSMGDTTTVHHTNHPSTAPPIFTIQLPNSLSFSSKAPDYLFLQNSQVVAEAGTSLTSSKAHLTLRERPLQMKRNHLTGNFLLEVPPLPLMKWKVNQLTMGSLELCDDGANKIAKMKKSSLLGSGDDGQKLEIYVPCDDFFVDLCVVSGFAAWTSMRTTKKVVEEVAGPGAGA